METYEFLIEQVIMRNESRLGDALTVCEEALSLYPSFAKLYTIKGRILLKMNRTKEALPVLEFAVQATEILPASHYNLGLAHLQVSRYLNTTHMYIARLFYVGFEFLLYSQG